MFSHLSLVSWYLSFLFVFVFFFLPVFPSILVTLLFLSLLFLLYCFLPAPHLYFSFLSFLPLCHLHYFFFVCFFILSSFFLSFSLFLSFFLLFCLSSHLFLNFFYFFSLISTLFPPTHTRFSFLALSIFHCSSQKSGKGLLGRSSPWSAESLHLAGGPAGGQNGEARFGVRGNLGPSP